MYANDLICIFMNINETIKKMHKNQRKNIKIILIINHYTDPEDTERVIYGYKTFHNIS